MTGTVARSVHDYLEIPGLDLDELNARIAAAEEWGGRARGEVCTVATAVREERVREEAEA